MKRDKIRELLIDQHANSLAELKQIIINQLKGIEKVQAISRTDSPPNRLELNLKVGQFKSILVLVKRECINNKLKWTIYGVGGA